MAWLLWALPLVVLVFLWTLNEFLQGSLKEILSGVLAIIIFALVGVAVFVSGWKIGGMALLGVFLLGNLFRPAALGIARRLIDYPDLGVDAYNEAQLRKTARDFGTDRYFKRTEREARDRQRHRASVVEASFRKADVQATLARNGGSLRDLEALYDRIEISTLPPRLREIALGNAALVDYFLGNSEPAEVDGKHARNLPGLNEHLTLTLWAKSNPGGPKPR